MKFLKKLSVLAVAAAFAVICTISSSAATIYILNGYSYQIVNNASISLCGWDNRTPELVVPDSIADRYTVSIAPSGFSGNDKFTVLDFSQTTKLRTISYLAFSNCAGISNDVVIPATVKAIGINAFQFCRSMPSVTIEGDVAVLPDQVFSCCTSLKTVTLKGNTTEIGDLAFEYCTQLERVDLPPTVTSISSSAFKECPNVTLGVYYDSYAYHYAQKKNLAYTLLDGVKLGDVNGDDDVTIADATEIQCYLTELSSLDSIHIHAADVDSDGSVDITDATTLQLYLAGYSAPYPIGEVMIT